MDVLRILETIEDYWFEKIPKAIWQAVCVFAWIVCIGPFIAVGWSAYKVWTGIKAGWVVARNIGS